MCLTPLTSVISSTIHYFLHFWSFFCIFYMKRCTILNKRLCNSMILFFENIWKSGFTFDFGVQNTLNLQTIHQKTHKNTKNNLVQQCRIRSLRFFQNFVNLIKSVVNVSHLSVNRSKKIAK